MISRLTASLTALALITGAAHAQPRTGWMFETTGFVAHQGEADLDNGGHISATRSAGGVSALYGFESGHAAGLSFNYGRQDYSFGGGAAPLWDDVRGYALSVPMQFRFDNGASVFVAPTIARAYEKGASLSDSTTYGVIAGASWQVTDTLRIGPGFGAFSKLEGSGADVFPILIVDWDIAPRWNVSTGSGIAATQGPGLTLSYAASDALKIGLGVRYESAEFRLNGSGPAPGGVGKDTSVPVVLSVDYEPNPGFALSAFAGAAFGGELTLEDSHGARISKQGYDTAPVAGLAVRLRF